MEVRWLGLVVCRWLSRWILGVMGTLLRQITVEASERFILRLVGQFRIFGMFSAGLRTDCFRLWFGLPGFLCSGKLFFRRRHPITTHATVIIGLNPQAFLTRCRLELLHCGGLPSFQTLFDLRCVDLVTLSCASADLIQLHPAPFQTHSKLDQFLGKIRP